VEDVEPDVGRRERKKRATHHALRVAALRLVAERGLEDVTVQDVADAADVSTRTFFNHFACKEDALVGVDPAKVEQLRGALLAQPAEAAPLEALRAVLLGVARLLEDRSDELLLQIAVARDNPQLRAREVAGFAQYERVLVEDIAERSGTDPRCDVYPALAAGAAVAALRASLSVWQHSGGGASLADLVGRAFDRLTDGLPPPEARRATGSPLGPLGADTSTIRRRTQHT
jgi:AcrR family transcriptional regulator